MIKELFLISFRGIFTQLRTKTMKTYTITFLDSNNNTLQDSYYTDCRHKAEQIFRIRNKDIKQILSLT